MSRHGHHSNHQHPPLLPGRLPAQEMSRCEFSENELDKRAPEASSSAADPERTWLSQPTGAAPSARVTAEEAVSHYAALSDELSPQESLNAYIHLVVGRGFHDTLVKTFAAVARPPAEEHPPKLELMAAPAPSPLHRLFSHFSARSSSRAESAKSLRKAA